jgi:hypothetical protein
MFDHVAIAITISLIHRNLMCAQNPIFNISSTQTKQQQQHPLPSLRGKADKNHQNGTHTLIPHHDGHLTN